MAKKALLPLVKAKQKNGNGAGAQQKKSALPITPIRSVEDVLNDRSVQEALRRSILEIEEDKEKGTVSVTYHLNHQKTYKFNDPEEWVRAVTVAWLVVERDYPANRMKLEVVVPRRTPNDWADILVYEDDACKKPYLVVENKEAGIGAKDREQGVEQLFGNANSLSIPLALYDDSTESILFDRANFPPTERKDNRLGTRNALPRQYGDVLLCLDPSSTG